MAGGAADMRGFENLGVTVVGSVDLNLVTTVAYLPGPDETVTEARRLGASVRLIARVGDDAEAGPALAQLRADRASGDQFGCAWCCAASARRRTGARPPVAGEGCRHDGGRGGIHCRLSFGPSGARRVVGGARLRCHGRRARHHAVRRPTGIGLGA